MTESLLSFPATDIQRFANLLDEAINIAEEEIPPTFQPDEEDRRKIDFGITLIQQYVDLVDTWTKGSNIIGWIKDCEQDFERDPVLCHLLRPDIWPHASRKSFVALLLDKKVFPDSNDIQRAVGLNLMFRQPPPIGCLTDQSLIYLMQGVPASVYNTWAQMQPPPVLDLPAERFDFMVVKM